MAIPTTRTKTKGNIKIDTEKCTGCGLCVYVCKDFGLEIKNNKAQEKQDPLFGCIGCGHCMAICPSGAITISGRTLSKDDLFALDKDKAKLQYEDFYNLLKQRRSIREFKNILVESYTIEKILNAAKCAPMGLPPSDVNVLVFDTKKKVRDFAIDFCNYAKGLKWLCSKWFLFLMRPFWGKKTDELFRNFLKPLLDTYTKNMDKGVNLVTYDAPLAIYFYASCYSDPADPIIAATYAMLAGEALGLGTCMIGGIHPLIQIGKKGTKFRQKHKIRYKSREGLFVLFGYKDVEYKKGIRRSFASVDYV